MLHNISMAGDIDKNTGHDPVQQGTTLYHGTPHRELINDIDMSKTWRSAHAEGFYAAPTAENAAVYANWENPGNKQGGFIYSMDVSGGQTWLDGNAMVDDSLVRRLQASMRALGKDPVSGHDFAKSASQLGARVEAFGDMRVQNLVAGLQQQFGTPHKSKPGAKTSQDIFRGAGIAGLDMPLLDTVVVLDPAAITQPKPYAFHSPQNPDASAVGKLLDVLNKGTPLPPALDRNLRAGIAKTIVAVEEKSPDAVAGMKSVRRLLETSGTAVSTEMNQHLEVAENAARRAVAPPAASASQSIFVGGAAKAAVGPSKPATAGGHLLLVDIENPDAQYAVRAGKGGKVSEIYAFNAEGKQIDVPVKPAQYSERSQIAMDLASERPAGPGKISVDVYVIKTAQNPPTLEKKEMQYKTGALDGIKAMHNGGAYAAERGMQQTSSPANYKMAAVAPKNTDGGDDGARVRTPTRSGPRIG